MSDIEDKILGLEPAETTQKEKTAQNNFAENVLWEVTKKGCGTSIFNGRMVFEMLDSTSKELVRNGAKSFEMDKYKFRLKK